MPYNVSLSQFEGPLDLLLHLIDKAQVNIRDIFVSEITAQYLEYVNNAKDFDMDSTSEFLIMAARLVFIKSRSVLPQLPFEQDFFDGMDDEGDPEELLIRQLREYKAYKDAAVLLSAMRESELNTYEKLPEEFILPEQVTMFNGGTVEQLYLAFKTILQKAKPDDEPEYRPLTHEVVVDKYNIRSCTNEIRAFLINRIEHSHGERIEVEFCEFFSGDMVRMRVIVMFMSLLEMLMRGEITVDQAEAFAPILITPIDLKTDDSGETYMDELVIQPPTSSDTESEVTLTDELKD